MRKLIVCLLVTFPLLAWSATVIDDAGKSLTSSKPAQRIISLAPDVTEILFAIGAGPQVVGVIAGSDYPEAAKKKQLVGTYSGLDLERVISLQPDLVIVWGNTFPREISVLRKMGIPIYVSKPRDITDIAHTMKNLGAITGQAEKASQSAEQFNQQLNALKQRYQQRQPTLRVFYQIGAYNLFTINKDSWINQAIEFCGGQNIFAATTSASPQVSWEAIVVAKPEVVVTDTKNVDWQKRWQRFPDIPAVKQKHMCAIEADLIDRAGPRLVQGVEQICVCLDKARG